MSEKGIRVVARVSVRPERLDETLAAFNALVAATRAEEGCLKYELLQNVDDPNDLTFVEEWASREALTDHFATEHFTAVAVRAEALLTTAPDIRTYSVIA